MVQMKVDHIVTEVGVYSLKFFTSFKLFNKCQILKTATQLSNCIVCPEILHHTMYVLAKHAVLEMGESDFALRQNEICSLPKAVLRAWCHSREFESLNPSEGDG